MMHLLKYDDFKTALLNGIKNSLPVEYGNYSVELHRITKDNQTFDGICMLDKNEHTAVSPVVYAEELYNSYIDGTSLDKVIKTATNLLFGNFETATDMDLDNIKENVVPVLTAQKPNENTIHIPFLDMEILFRWIIKRDENGVFGTMITNEVAKAFALDTDNILEKAKDNMRKIMPVSVMPLKTAIPEYKFSSDDIPVFVLSNKYSIDGAAYILDEIVLQQLHDIFKKDFYILLPCVHEALIILKGVMSENTLKQAAENIAQSITNPEEKLTSSLYKYNGSISLI